MQTTMRNSFGRPGQLLAVLLAIAALASAWQPAIPARAAAPTVLYAAPNGSGSACTQGAPCNMAAARDRVRAISVGMTGDIVVYLRGGVYTLAAPLELRETATMHDSGTGGFLISYLAYPGETPVLSGGRTIAGWSLYDGAKGIYRAFAEPGLATRQLYVNGQRAIRARGNPATFVKTAAGFAIDNSGMQGWGNPTAIELVSRNAWRHFRCGVASISATQIALRNPCWANTRAAPNPGPPWNGSGGPGFDAPAWVENAYELLDRPREWYYDSSGGYIYYIPSQAEDMGSASVVIPLAEQLLDIGGESPARTIHDIRFAGIHFEYATWLRPSGDEGYADNQAGVLWSGTSSPPAAAKTLGNVSLQYAERITLERNTFAHLGGTAIDLGHAPQHNTILGNVVYDISGGGIQLGEVTDFSSADPQAQTDGNLIQNNLIYAIGQEYEDSAGIWVGYAKNTLIDHNEIASTPYTGISVGWGWGANSYAANNRIASNFVHGVMRVLRDGGAIYTLSAQGSPAGYSEISGNFLTYSQSANGSHGIYLDEGTAYYDAHDNVVTHIADNWYNMWISTIHDNKIRNNYADSNRSRNSCTNCTVANNTTTLTDLLIPPAARAIMSSAGLETSYADSVPDLLFNDDYDRLSYHGTWATSGGRGLGDYGDDVHYTKSDGDYVEFSFRGTGIDLIGERNQDQGAVEIWLDGVMRATVSAASAARLPQQRIFSAACLAAGTHTLRAVKRSGQYMLVDALQVRQSRAAGTPGALLLGVRPAAGFQVYLPMICS